MRLANVKHRVKTAAVTNRPEKLWNDRHVKQVYQRSFRRVAITRAPETKTAVVVHLYYPESWQIIKSRLVMLGSHKFDLFVTLPSQKISFAEVVLSDFENAYIIESPNRGRDVLPFLMVAKELQQQGYSYVLKLHSKKSTHRTDGADWFNSLLSQLLPSNPSTLAQLFEVLSKMNTGIVGPKGEYVPLTVNFEANGTHMTRIINKLFSKQVSYEVLQKKRGEYGFFAGTMFWARLDAIDQVIGLSFGPRQFEVEAGQIDSTFAHALERIFNIVPEINNRDMYEIGDDSIARICYKSDNVPDWSDVYIGP